jgi:thiamine phosphate synthase YjbQ (UPF0047 family)
MVELTMHQVETTGQGDVRDLTTIVARALHASTLKSGLATIAVIGSTAGVTTIEFDTRPRTREVAVQFIGE